MTKEEYNKIEQSWQEILDSARKNYDSILTNEDLLKLSVKQLQDLIIFSRDYERKLDFLFTDFRHIIGMSNITSVNRSRLTSIFRELTSYRPDAKVIAGINSFDNVGGLPNITKYELRLTPGIVLTSEIRPGQSKELAKEKAVEAITNIDVTFLSPILFKFSRDNLEAAKKVLSKAGLSCSIEKLNKIIDAQKSVNGIKFSILQDGSIQASAKTDKSREHLTRVYNSRI